MSESDPTARQNAHAPPIKRRRLACCTARCSLDRPCDECRRDDRLDREWEARNAHR